MSRSRSRNSRLAMVSMGLMVQPFLLRFFVFARHRHPTVVVLVFVVIVIRLVVVLVFILVIVVGCGGRGCCCRHPRRPHRDCAPSWRRDDPLRRRPRPRLLRPLRRRHGGSSSPPRIQALVTAREVAEDRVQRLRFATRARATSSPCSSPAWRSLRAGRPRASPRARTCGRFSLVDSRRTLSDAVETRLQRLGESVGGSRPPRRS